MNHSKVKVDINETTYISVEGEQFTGQFRWMTGSDGPMLLASSMTLRNAPTGWVDHAEKYLDEEGFNVIGR